MKSFKVGSIAFVVLGILHIAVQALGILSRSASTIAMKHSMEMHKINLIGEHNLLQFYLGFSFMMGFLLSAFGVQNLLIVNTLNKKICIVTIGFTSIGLLISILYFHLLATSFILFSLICYIISYRILMKSYN
ncbi:MAG TPA: hypothetical protein VK796_02705 [Cytophaga sp.]|jgi:hypothetical protein|nr:hypothetical protein [Cytophaga sp.]